MTTSPLEIGRYRALFFGGWLLVALLHTILLYRFGFSWETSSTDSFVSNGLLAAACWLMINNLEFYRPQQARYLLISVWCLLVAGIWIVTLQWLLPYVVDNEPKFMDFFAQSWPFRYSIGFLLVSWVATVSILWYNQQEQQASIARKTDAEKLTREAELYKLRLQLQPHFLFNSLNSINALIGSKPQEARNMVYQLSEFLRSTLKKDEYQYVSLAEELQHLELYLEIEKMRFGHRLETRIITDEASRELKLPPMLLQPLVENAIKFGLYDTTGNVTISLQAKALNNLLEIAIQNPYDPQTAGKRKGTGFGLKGVQRRLYLLFARHDLLVTEANEQTFTATLKIPQTL